MPTSERLYYSDSFLTTFSGTVVDTREIAAGAGQPSWQLSLDRSAFYPSSGGQPFDTGMLRVQSPDGPTRDVGVD